MFSCYLFYFKFSIYIFHLKVEGENLDFEDVEKNS